MIVMVMSHKYIVGLWLVRVVDNRAHGTEHRVDFELLAPIVNLQTGMLDAGNDNPAAIGCHKGIDSSLLRILRARREEL